MNKFSSDAFWRRVRSCCQRLKCDGCTGVPDWRRPCCDWHDLLWRTGHDLEGNPVSGAQANVEFRKCLQHLSRLRWFSPMSWWRYAAVTISKRWLHHPTGVPCSDSNDKVEVLL